MIFATELRLNEFILPLKIPAKPWEMPTTSRLDVIAVRTTARMAAFIPGASPPDVITPIFLSMLVSAELAMHLHLSKIKKDQFARIDPFFIPHPAKQDGEI